ncbi:MAG: enoyl-CoA hydratase/isomerase family protein, partial [Acidimicrobiia bacterium]
MDFHHLIFDVTDGVATMTFDRPAEANAMNLPLMEDLMHASIRCDEDPGIRAAVVTGSGRFFSAGGDLASFGTAGDGLAALLKEMTVYFHAAVSRFSRMNAPLVAAVNGFAAGAGMSLVAA